MGRVISTIFSYGRVTGRHYPYPTRCHPQEHYHHHTIGSFMAYKQCTPFQSQIGNVILYCLQCRQYFLERHTNLHGDTHFLSFSRCNECSSFFFLQLYMHFSFFEQFWSITFFSHFHFYIAIVIIIFFHVSRFDLWFLRLLLLNHHFKIIPFDLYFSIQFILKFYFLVQFCDFTLLFCPLLISHFILVLYVFILSISK